MPASVAEGEDEKGRCCVRRAGHQRRGGVPVRERADGLLGIVIGLFFPESIKVGIIIPKSQRGWQPTSLTSVAPGKMLMRYRVSCLGSQKTAHASLCVPHRSAGTVASVSRGELPPHVVTPTRLCLCEGGRSCQGCWEDG